MTSSSPRDTYSARC